MATSVQHRRGSTAQHATFTGAIGEITVDTTKKVAVVHDGSTAGGVPLAREDQKNEGSLGYAQEIKTDNYAVGAADGGKMLIANKATAITFTLGAAASLTSKFVAAFKNINAGALSIAPTGAELIDGANTAITVPTGASVIIKCDGASFRTYLSNGDVTGNAINTAPALTGANLADNDKLGVYDASAGSLASVLFSELIAGIFKTARTIANAQFAAASFKLFNAAAKALTFDTTALTADRKATMPDRDVNLGLVPIAADFVSAPITVTLGSNGLVAHGLPSAPKKMRAFIIFTAAVGPFAIGDIIEAGFDSGGTANGYGVQLSIPAGNATQIKYQVGNTNVALILSSTGAASGPHPTAAQAQLIIVAEL